ncbi:MOSC domain-containing protein [Brevibacillus sp. BC25]|uniref:MOSC domain-containing protein n=1 Tax=Brevibacillus sp. BC25 TaxID=1144308 RepID=UPI0002714EE4|nr:MOSC domain-containing protein [Brevibacillus sp. BC25]EJL26889.1 putative Fe-S protein [Brevibacillus sp. BC25]
MKKVGTLQTIFRHPVKGMRGEELSSSTVDEFGLYGDRAYYFWDNARQGKYLSADVVPALIGYHASMSEGTGKEAYPPIRIEARDGSVHTWDDALFAHVAETAKRSITPMISSPQDGGVNWEDHILLVTDASLREIARQIDAEQVDPRRFRGNLVVVLEDDEPFAEDKWLGKQIKINDVTLQVNKHCERCVYVNIDPDTLAMTPAVLKACVKRHNNHFGVYASVVTTGSVSQGDDVFLVEIGSDGE